MGKIIKAGVFSGMNNTMDKSVIDKKTTPKIILNAWVNRYGQLINKPVSSLVLPFSNLQRGWGGDTWAMFIANNRLYAWDSESLIDLGTVNDTNLSFVEINQIVYISGLNFRSKIFDGTSLKDWGISPPAMLPKVDIINGDLPYGVYSLCFTYTGSPISGNGYIIQIEASGGLEIFNRPDDAIVWITPPNSQNLLYAGEVDEITSIPQNIQTIPSLNCTFPPSMSHLTVFAGRIWGSNKKNLYFTEPIFDWWKPNNKILFEQEIVLIAKIDLVGMFISSAKNTWFLAGTNPSEMTLKRVGNGAIEGTLIYTEVQIDEQLQTLPIWMGVDGIVVGSPNGTLFTPSKNKLKMEWPEKGTTGVLTLNNEDIYIFCSDLPIIEDIETKNAFINNNI